MGEFLVPHRAPDVPLREVQRRLLHLLLLLPDLVDAALEQVLQRLTFPQVHILLHRVPLELLLLSLALPLHLLQLVRESFGVRGEVVLHLLNQLVLVDEASVGKNALHEGLQVLLRGERSDVLGGVVVDGLVLSIVDVGVGEVAPHNVRVTHARVVVSLLLENERASALALLRFVFLRICVFLAFSNVHLRFIFFKLLDDFKKSSGVLDLRLQAVLQSLVILLHSFECLAQSVDLGLLLTLGDL